MAPTATPTHAAASWFEAVGGWVPPERPAIVFRDRSFTLLPGNDVLDDDGRSVPPGARRRPACSGTARAGGSRSPATPSERARTAPSRCWGGRRRASTPGAEKVFAQEVEQVLLAHDAIADCLVVGVPSPRWGQEVRALVVGRSGSVDHAALDAHARLALAGYKVPKRYIAVGRIERLVSGKPDYRWAQDRATC